MKYFACFVLIVLLTTLAHAEEFVVKTVCIVPTDASKPDHQTIEKFKRVVKDVRDFYKKEMKRHGFGSKTFNLETDTRGNPALQVINGKYSKTNYAGGDTIIYANQDLPVSKHCLYCLDSRDTECCGRLAGNSTHDTR